jgi:hypothetical protein
MNLMKPILIACSMIAIGAAGLRAASENEDHARVNPLNNFNFASVSYLHRIYTGGHDGDGSSEEVSLAFSKEWNLQRERKQISLQIMPSFSLGLADYDQRPATAHTVEAGTRLGLLAHSKARNVSLGIFTDIHGSFDSIQDRPRQYAVMVRPGFQATFRISEPLALLFEYRYHGLTSHHIPDTLSLDASSGRTGGEMDLRRLENSFDHELRYGIAWAPFVHRQSWPKDIVIQAGALTYESLSTQTSPRTALGAYVSIRKAL